MMHEAAGIEAVPVSRNAVHSLPAVGIPADDPVAAPPAAAAGHPASSPPLQDSNSLSLNVSPSSEPPLALLVQKDASDKSPEGVQSDSTKPPGAAEDFGSFKMFATLGVALLLVWVFAWLYLGTSWNPVARTKSLEVAVLDCDAGMPYAPLNVPVGLTPVSKDPEDQSIGATLLARSIWNPRSPAHRMLTWRKFTCSAVQALSPPHTGPGCPPALQPACLAQLKDSLQSTDYWAALFIPSNLTSNTLNNSQGTNSSSQFSPTPLLYIKTSGRHLSTYSMLDAKIRALHSGLASNFAATFATDPAFAPKTNPFFFISPLPLTPIDLAPVNYFGQNMAAFLLNLFTWMGSIIVTTVMYDFRLPVENPEKLPPGYYPPRSQLILACLTRCLTAILATLVGSCLNIGIVLILGRGSGRGAQFEGFNVGYAIAFLWYSSFSYLAINNLAITLFGPVKYSTFSTLFLILQLATSTGIFPWELSNPFFRLGHALPLAWGVQGLREIFFGVGTNRIWLSWVVLTVWGVVCGGLVIAIWVVRTKGRLQSRRVRDTERTGSGSIGEIERELSQAGMAYPLTAL